MERIPKRGDKVTLSKDDYCSGCKKGLSGTVEHVSIWHWRADVLLNDKSKFNIHFGNIELAEK
jgi:hypothetical protein